MATLKLYVMHIHTVIISYPSLNVYYMYTITNMKEKTGVLVQSCSLILLICQFVWLIIHHGHTHSEVLKQLTRLKAYFTVLK